MNFIHATYDTPLIRGDKTWREVVQAKARVLYGDRWQNYVVAIPD